MPCGGAVRESRRGCCAVRGYGFRYSRQVAGQNRGVHKMSITTIWRMGEDPEGFYMTMRCGPAMDYEPVGFLIPGNSKLVHYFPDKEEFLALVRSHCRLEPVPDGSGYLQMV